MPSFFSEPFMQLALAASAVTAIVCAYLGVYVVLRRVVFVGAALSQVSAAGVALGFLLGWSPGPVAFAATLVGVALFALAGGSRRVTVESVLGLGYVVASAATILLLGKTSHGQDDVINLLFGNILAVTPQDLWQMGALAGLVLAVHLAFYKEFLFVSFDPEMAATLGFRVRAWNVLFSLTLGVAIAAVTRVAGSLLTFSFLVLPPMTALVFGRRMGATFAIAVGSAVLAAVAGVAVSYTQDLPTGPTMIVVSFGLLAACATARWAWNGVVHRAPTGR